MAKKSNTTFQLAHWFVTDFLGKTWSRNIHLRHLANAKTLLNPKKDPHLNVKPKCFAPDQIMECLLDMKKQGVRNINTLMAVAWSDKAGLSYIEKFTEPEPMPPLYMRGEVARWTKKYGESVRG